MLSALEALDHRDIVAAYDLGHIEQHSPGLIHWHPNGAMVLRKLEKWILDLHQSHGYHEVRSPALLSRELWERSGHWEKYQDLMFVAGSQEEGEQPYAVKPMSCPGQIGIYGARRRSYRELPVRLFEFGHVHRREPSGSLSGWMRLRGFIQDDSHVFCEPGQIQEAVAGFAEMVNKAYRAFGFKGWSWQISLRPERRAGSDELWDQAEDALRQACKSLGLDVIEVAGDGAFYGPKLEAALVDRMGRRWQCGVAQVDFVLPERFDLEYQNHEGHRVRPVMIHHAVLGSLERWLSIVMENQGGLPDWLAPCAVAILPIGDEQHSAAIAVASQFQSEGISVRVLEGGPLSGRIRMAKDIRIPHMGIIGKREAESGQASVRGEDGKSAVMPVEEWIGQMKVACAAPSL
jgi:threonyl-tRNA synthetase